MRLHLFYLTTLFAEYFTLIYWIACKHFPVWLLPQVLMEGTPNYMHYAEVLQIFQGIEGVERVHNLRIWALSINKVALSAHLAIGK